MFSYASDTLPARRLLKRIEPITVILVIAVLQCAHDVTASHQQQSTTYETTVASSSFSAQLQSHRSAVEFAHSLYNVSIPENSVGKTYAVQPANEDRLGLFVTPDLDVKYRIANGDKDKLFKAEERLVGDFAFLAIRTRTGNVILNREKVDEYRLDVRATITRRDKNNNKIIVEAETTVVVRVLDTNDLSPLFYPTEYSVAVAEDTALHRSIVRVIAEDADLGINGEIYYSFLDGTDYFAVHPTTGVITLTRPLKFTDRSVHDLVVVATDRGANTNNRLSQPSKAKVHVKVKQVSFLFRLSFATFDNSQFWAEFFCCLFFSFFCGGVLSLL